MLIVDNIKYDLQSFLDTYSSTELVHLRSICDVIQQWQDDNNYIEITTSGSTSTPKTVRLYKEAMIASALQTQEFFDYKAGDQSLLCIPVRFIGGMMMLIRSIISDIDLHIVIPSLRPLEQLSINLDFVPMTPAQLSESLTHDYNSVDLIDTILLGGGPVSPSLMDEIVKLKAKVYHSFGMTETISHIAVRQLNHTTDNMIFSALSKIKLDTDDNNCLIINADYIETPVYTNDIVDLISERQFVWKGRLDNVINSGGLKIYPELVEQKISEIIEEDFFIIGIEDDVLGTKVALVIESEESIDSKTLLSELSKNINKHETPKVIFTTPKFIRTATGKTQRSATLNQVLHDNKLMVR